MLNVDEFWTEYQMITVQEAIEKINALARSFGEESIPLEKTLGRVIAEDIYSDRDYPPFNRASMDGIAIRAEDFQDRQIRDFEIAGEVFAGSSFEGKISEGSCVKIMTGAPVPEDCDVVVRVEDTIVTGEKVRIITDTVKPRQNIALKGEDIQKGVLFINRGIVISPAEISSLAVVGKNEVKVFRRPSVAIVSTGNEIVHVGEEVSSYQIRDSNAYAIEAFFGKQGIPVSLKKLVRDNQDDLEKALKEALQYDIVVTSGGVSMGEADFLPNVFDKLGVKRIFHKVQVKPGKPIWVGEKGNSVVFGLPGNPVSVQVACKIFVEAFLRKSLNRKECLSVKLPISEERKKKTKFDEFFPCTIDSANITFVKAVGFNGSGDITATLGSHGIALHPAESGDLNPGEIVEFFPW